jgi:phage tail-like protein
MSFDRAALLPPVPAPPHDPRTLRLDARAGWRAAVLAGVTVEPGRCGGLTLAPLVSPAAALAAADGSFGGLTWPAHLAEAPDGAVFLLDRGSARLARFDGCACAFVTVPHTGGTGPGARQFDAPSAIAACGEMLLVADTGHARISVFSFFGYALRAHWSPPPGATPQPWVPVSVAARRGRIAVADKANGAVHLFAGTGRWLGMRAGLGAVAHVAMNREGAIHVTRDGAEGALRLTWPGDAPPVGIDDPAALAPLFPPLPVGLGPEGAVDMARFCTDPGRARWFDAAGRAIKGTPAAPAATLAKAGSYVSEALDSRIYRCTWDRIRLGLKTPPGTRLRVLTHTAEVPRSAAEIAALPAGRWDEMPGFVARGAACETDTLVRSGPGRYLWLRLEFAGDGSAAPALSEVEIAFPRISLRRYLPGVYGEEPVAAEFTDRLLAIFDRGLRDIETRIDDLALLFDPLSAPAGTGRGDFLGWLASWIGVTLDRQLPLARRRLILKNAGRLFRLRGTKTGLREMLGLYLGLPQEGCPEAPAACGPCTPGKPPAWTPPGLILEHFTLRRWLFVGAGRLGSDAMLWGERIVNRTRLGDGSDEGGARLGLSQLKTVQDPLRDPFHVHAHRFTVFLPAWIARLPGRRRLVERLIRAESPAHTAADINWVAPRFRVGVQSMIGFDAVIGCYPQGITLDEDTLGRGTMLTAADGRDRPPRLGRTGRIGTSTL